MSELIGRTLGPYQIVEQLGLGGMATVFKAYHPAMDRYVAIKVLPQHMARDESFRARFQREARTIARLEHRYILPVHDTGEQDGIHYLVMRYTDGGTLSDLIAGGALSPAHAARLVGQVAEALAYAHRQGVVHRDIKPANILIGRDGDALLSDFGIARIVEGTMQLTGEGMLIGTPFYMAPEQVQGQPSDARTDIYALGVVLYEALTGRRPYEAETPLAVALMHLHNPLPPPRVVKPDLPESLERIILRAMAKSPADRFQDAREMADALYAALATLDTAPGVPAPQLAAPAATPAPEMPRAAAAPATVVLPDSRPRRLWPWLGGAGALALVAVVAVAAVILSRPAPRVPDDDIVFLDEPTVGTGEVAGALPPLPTLTPRENLSVLANTSFVYDLAAAGDVILAGTSGGLVVLEGDERRVYTAADGAPFTAVRAVLVQPDNTVWLAGDSDVVRVVPTADGIGEMTSYTQADGLIVSYVRAFLAEPDGAVLAGGYSNDGLVRWDGSAWSKFELPLDNPSGDVQALARGPDGALYIGTNEALLRWDGQSLIRYAEEQGVGPVNISELLVDSDGTLWAAAGDKGLLRLDPDAGVWERVPVITDNLAVWSIAQLADGRLWAASWELVAESADGGASWKQIGTTGDNFGYSPRSIVQDASGVVWVGTNEGLGRYADGGWSWLRQEGELPDSMIGRLGMHDGALWVAPLYGGTLATVNPDDRTVELVETYDGIAFAHVEDTLWYGTNDGLVELRDGGTRTVTEEDGLPSNRVDSLLATDTTLWVGTSQGLAAYDLASDSISESVSEFGGAFVSTLLAAPDGSVWAGTTTHDDSSQPLMLGRFDGQEWQIWHAGEGPLAEDASAVAALTADANGNVWVAVWGGGIHRWDGAQWRAMGVGSNAPQGNVQALVEHEGAIWAAGQLGALFRWDGGRWEAVEVEGLPWQVNSLQFDESGALWIGTLEGLYRYQP